MSKPEKSAKKHVSRATSRTALPSATRFGVAAVCGFLFLAVVLLYGQTLRHEFLNYDDNDYVYDNPQVVRGLTAQGMAWAFTHTHASNWHPVTWLSHMLDCQIYGVAPWGHHLTNVLLHAATAILLFLVLWRMTGDYWPSAFTAAIFAVHPLRVESVAWVAERKDVLSGLFFMLTLGAYLGYVRRPFSLARYLIVLSLFALGLMAKSMLVTLPLVLLLLDYWPLKRMTPKVICWGGGCTATPVATVQLSPQRCFSLPLRLAMEKVPLLALAAASCLMTIWAQANSIATNDRIPLTLRAGNAVVSYIAYIGHFFFPADLVVLYPWAVLPTWKIVGALVVLAAICISVVVWRRRCPYLLTGWFWYVVMLLPVIGLVQVGSQAMADRYTYLPQIGLCIAIAWGTARLSQSWPYRRLACGVAAAMVLAVLMGCAWRQISFWRNSETLWTRTLECTTQNYLAQHNLGKILAETGRMQAGIDLFQQALLINPDIPEAHVNLGVIFIRLGRLDEAISHFEQALALKPNYTEALNDLGLALFDKGQVREAMEYYEKALALNPDHPASRLSLAIALAHMGRTQEAIEQYMLVLRIKPDYIMAHNKLGISLAKSGRMPEAIEQYRQALAIKPDNPDALNDLGKILLDTGQFPEAIEHLRQALRLKEDYLEAHNNLGVALVQTGKPQEAIKHYERALALNPDFIPAYSNLALAYAQLNRTSDAVAAAQKALELARAQKQTALAKQIENWLNSYKAGIGD